MYLFCFSQLLIDVFVFKVLLCRPMMCLSNCSAFTGRHCVSRLVCDWSIELWPSKPEMQISLKLWQIWSKCGVFDYRDLEEAVLGLLGQQPTTVTWQYGGPNRKHTHIYLSRKNDSIEIPTADLRIFDHGELVESVSMQSRQLYKDR